MQTSASALRLSLRIQRGRVAYRRGVGREVPKRFGMTTTIPTNMFAEHNASLVASASGSKPKHEVD